MKISKKDYFLINVNFATGPFNKKMIEFYTVFKGLENSAIATKL